MRKLFLLAVTPFLLAFALSFSATRSEAQPLGPLLPPHTLPGATMAVFPSPDHLYAARLTGGDAIPSFLSIYQVSGRHRRLAYPRIAGAQSFVWVPHHPHMLVVAADGSVDSGAKAQLSLWNGGKYFRELVPLKHQIVNTYDIRESEGFDIDGVTPDGKVLVYNFLNADGGGPIYVRLRLSTP